MWSLNLVIAGCLCVFVLAGTCCCDPVISPDSVIKPNRPKNFGTPSDLRMYLDHLGEYYSLVGRPRFGKRTVAAKPVTRDLIPSYLYQEQHEPQEYPDVLDILTQYYQPQEQE